MSKSPFRKIETTKRDSELGSLLHSEHDVVIEKLVVGGDGLGRLQFQDKSLVIFVPQTAPGDTVRARITKVEKNYLNGEVLRVITPSSHRRPAPCPYASECGGCTWQHINDDEQLRQKEQILRDLLKKNLPQNTEWTLLPSVPSESAFHYRNRIQLKQLGTQLGYFRRGSHDIVDIEHCLIAEKSLSEQIPLIKKKLRPAKELKKFELRLNHLGDFEHYPIGHDGEGLSFSQVNNSVNTHLVREAVSLVCDKNPAFLTELYAGAGNFTFALLENLPDLQLESAEMNSKLTTFAVKKITDLRLHKRALAFTTDCESYVARRPLSSEMILLDPPRSGCSDTVLQKIITADAKNIVYISCHPAFLARDLKKILENQPQYRISHLQIFDMFPQTDHFETLVMLTK